MKRCRRCIMPESYPGISFNSEGICSLCLDYRPDHRPLGKEKLVEILNSSTRTSAYDCVVPISGGKDSTFILYYAVKQLNLNPIAVTYDSGFQTAIAEENRTNACRILSVPLVVVKSPQDSQSQLLSESLLISQKVGHLTQFCGNCEAIIRMVSMNTAKSYGVPYVLWGSSALETLSNANYEKYRSIGQSKKAAPSSFLSSTRRRIGAVLRNPRRIREIPRMIYPQVGYHAIKYDLLSIFQRLRLDFPIKYALTPHSIPPFAEHDPKFVHFYDYIAWDSMENMRILKDELNWKHPIDRPSRFDCSIHCLHNYEYLRRYGISHDGVNFCNFIRDNKMSRKEGMAREDHIRNSVDGECRELIERVGLEHYRMP